MGDTQGVPGLIRTKWVNHRRDYQQFLIEKQLKACASFARCCGGKWTVDSSHCMLWVLSHLNPFVTFTKLHVEYLSGHCKMELPGPWGQILPDDWHLDSSTQRNGTRCAHHFCTGLSQSVLSSVIPHRSGFCCKPPSGKLLCLREGPGLADTPSPALRLLSWPQPNRHPPPAPFSILTRTPWDHGQACTGEKGALLLGSCPWSPSRYMYDH